MKSLRTFSCRLKAILILCAFGICTNDALAQVNNWTGNINNDWFTVGNWSQNEVPGSNNDLAYIPDVANDPVIGGNRNAFARAIQVAPGGSLHIQSGSSLTIDNTTVGLKNEGSVNNFGTLNIANPGLAGGNSLENYGTFINNEGSVLSIDKSASNGIYNAAGSFINAATIKIGISGAGIGGNGIENHASFNNNTGNIHIDRTANHGLINFSSFTNSGNMLIGANGAIGGNGIENQAIFENNGDASLQIDRTVQNGIFNTRDAVMTNQSVISIGTINAVGKNGILNSVGTIHNQNGSIHIGQTQIGIFNLIGTFNNEGNIEIDPSTPAGIQNGDIDLNNIDPVLLDLLDVELGPVAHFNHLAGTISAKAVENFGTGIFHNYAAINIVGDGTFSTTYGLFVAGITNTGQFTNDSGSIHVDHIQAGIWNFSFFNSGGLIPGFDGNSVFVNNSEIVIGEGADFCEIGIVNSADFTNTGTIQIDHTTNFGVANMPSGLLIFGNPSGNFLNQASIVIGGHSTVGVGILNRLNFVNEGGSISIDRTNPLPLTSSFYNVFSPNGEAIANVDQFTNQGVIAIGANAAIDGAGVYNGGLFKNESGNVHIDRTTYEGVLNWGIVENQANIQIGGSGAIGGAGLYNGGLTTNDGEIHIDQTLGAGIAVYARQFTNNSIIRLGANHPVGADGIHNQGLFQNNAGAEISIDQAGMEFSLGNPGGNGIENGPGLALVFFGNDPDLEPADTAKNFINKGTIQIAGNQGIGLNGILNKSDFTNYAAISIGSGASIGKSGIYHSGNGYFVNEAGAQITVDQVENFGIFTDIGAPQFTNVGDIAVGQNGSIGLDALWNGADFANISCATLKLYSALHNLGNIQNDGLMYVNTDKSHLNSGVFTNDGILNYAQNNPVPNVVNHDVMILPIDSECGAISNALQIGNAMSFDVENTWHKNENLSDPAGSYNAMTNVFMPENLSEGSHILYFQVHDQSNGCTRTVSIALTLDDVTAPSITCPANAIIEALPNCTGFLENYTPISLDDNCTAQQAINVYQTMSNPFVPFLIGHDDTKTITLTADDGHGNTQSCTFMVTLKDLAPPNIQCKNATITLDAASEVAITAIAIYEDGTDNCGTVIPQTVAPSNFSCTELGANSVVLTATDGHGNTATCAATVTIVDNVAPTAICQNTTVNLNASGQGTLASIDVFQGGSDNCGSVNPQSVSPNTFNCNNLGQNSVILTVNDGHGNTATCIAMVTVVDNVAPMVICKDETVFLDANGSASVVSSQVFQSGTDNCGLVNQVSITPNTFTCNNIGPNVVTLSVNDGHGNTANCTATLTVLDKLAPTVTCQNISVNLNTAGAASITTAAVFQSGTDNCGAVNQQTVSPNSFNCSNIGANLVTLIVNDGHGNTGLCTATVTVKDVTAPVMVCKNVTLNLGANGQVLLSVAQVNNGSFDNCNITFVGLSQTVFTCANIGNNSVSLSGKDASYNIGQCTSVVTVLDQILPVAKCKNTTANLDINGTVTVATSAVNNGSTDNCTYNLTLTPNTFSCANIGSNLVTLRATDAAGNTAACTAKVMVKDMKGPTARCKNPTIYLDEAGNASLSVAQVNNGSTDACGISTMSISKTLYNCGEITGPNSVTLSLTDIHGNSSSCIASVKVLDVLPPTAICEDVTVQLAANGKVAVYPSELASNSYDNCSVYTYSPSAKLYTTANIGPNNLSIIVNDFSGNQSTCVSVVTVEPFSGLRDQQDDITANGLGFNVYPNPTSGDVFVAFELPVAQSVMLRIFDLQGRMILNQEVLGLKGENTLPIHLQGFASGMYLLDFQTGIWKTQTRVIYAE